ncbi:MAG TPA: glycosyltransferase [Gemmatimonadales bacterium]|nr:glycosyltransferase [Gemmatimonadales bacterium]
MRIAQILAPGPFGGLEQVVAQLSVGLTRRGHEVLALVVIEDGQGALPSLIDDLSSGGVRVELVRTPHRSYLQERRLAGRLLEEARPGVAHMHGYHADVLLRSVAQGLGIPTLGTAHGFTGGGRKNRLFEWLQRRSHARMDVSVAVSGPVAERLVAAGVARARIRVIRNAWAAPGAFLAREEARNRLGIDPSSRVVGWVGRMTPEKGPDVAVEALALTREDITLSFVGAGRMESGLRERARELGIGSRIRWHGVVPEAWRYFRAFDAWCLSSHTEGTPISLLEAMAAGVPVIATRVGGVPDVVAPAEAFLVPPADPGALATAMNDATGMDQAARVTAAGRRLESEFGIEPWLDAYEKVYRELMSSKADR